MEVPDIVVRIFSGFEQEFHLLGKALVWFSRNLWNRNTGLLYSFFLNLKLIYKNSDVVLWINYELATREIH